MVRKKTVKIHAPEEFRNFLYQKKAEDPRKTLQEIMRDMAKSTKGKNGNFWGKI